MTVAEKVRQILTFEGNVYWTFQKSGGAPLPYQVLDGEKSIH